MASEYVKLKNKLFPSFKNDYRTEFYINPKEHILKLIDSNDFKNFSPYNHTRIKNTIKRITIDPKNPSSSDTDA